MASERFQTASSNDKTTQPFWLQVTRWVLLIPAAFVGSRIIFTLAEVATKIVNSDPDGRDSWLTIVWNDLFVAGAWGAGFVWLASLIAPQAKPVVAGIAAGCVLTTSALSLLVVVDSNSGFGVDHVRAILSILSSLGAAIWVAVLAYQDELEWILDDWLEDRFG